VQGRRRLVETWEDVAGRGKDGLFKKERQRVKMRGEIMRQRMSDWEARRQCITYVVAQARRTDLAGKKQPIRAQGYCEAQNTPD
jgi:hypothetical protein